MNTAPALRELAADAICWELQPAPEPLRAPDDLLVDAILDAASYRMVAQQAIHALHGLTQQHDRLREQHARLRAEYAALRAAVMEAECRR